MNQRDLAALRAVALARGTTIEAGAAIEALADMVEAAAEYEQVGWLHDAGRMFVSGIKALPEGQPRPEGWEPVYVKRATAPPVPQEPEQRMTYQEWLGTLAVCPTCGSDNPVIWVTGTVANPDRERCHDPWHDPWHTPDAVADTPKAQG